jgi:hypothetical protein
MKDATIQALREVVGDLNFRDGAGVMTTRALVNKVLDVADLESDTKDTECTRVLARKYRKQYRHALLETAAEIIRIYEACPDE